MKKRKVAVFDFDGTITTKDTLLDFIKFSCGSFKFYSGLFLFSPFLMLMKLHLLPNWWVKQKFFSWFFKGWNYSEFACKGKEFSPRIKKMINLETQNIIISLLSNDVNIYVVSASINEWVVPCCKDIGIENVICTKVEVKDNVLTGKFATKNCYGQEKVDRFLEIEPDRTSYFLYAYGDSLGDRQIIDFADEGHWVHV